MKKWMMLAAALVLLTAMTACGGNSDKENADSSEVALDSFYAGLAEEYHWTTEDAAASEADGLLLSNIEGEMLDSYYPGLSEIATKQLVAKAPLMSAVVNEVVFLQCETDEDADKAAEILQKRIDYQVGDETNPGGAWYPESIESWKQAQVIREGTYVAMIASAEHQADIAEKFQQQFQ